MFALLRMSGLAGALLLAPAVALAVQAEAESQAAGNMEPASDGGIVWRSGPHWNGSILRTRVETSACMSNVIVIEIEYRPRLRRPWLSRVAAISINGNAVGRERLDTINLALQSFESPPEFSPECLGDNFQLNLNQVEHSRVSRSEYFDLGDPGDH